MAHLHNLTAATEAKNKLGLREVLQRFVDDQWTAAHYTEQQRCEILLEQFKRQVAADLELLELVNE